MAPDPLLLMSFLLIPVIAVVIYFVPSFVARPPPAPKRNSDLRAQPTPRMDLARLGCRARMGVHQRR